MRKKNKIYLNSKKKKKYIYIYIVDIKQKK